MDTEEKNAAAKDVKAAAGERKAHTTAQNITATAGETPTADDLAIALVQTLRAELSSGYTTKMGAMTLISTLLDGLTGITGINLGHILSPEERKRMVSSGVRNHGFAQVCCEKARDMPHLLPSWLTINRMEHDFDMFEEMQRMHDSARRLSDLSTDALLLASDSAYRNATGFYNSVKEAVRHKVPGAELLLEELSPYFHRDTPKKKDKR